MFCTAYLDDILIYSDNQKDHDRHVEWVLTQLRKAGIQCDIEKSEFNVQEVKYLGLIIGTDGIRMDPVKVKAILEWETPKDVKGVSSFHGFANFYRRFIENFSLKALPLTRLTGKDVPFVWTDKEQKAFDDLKQAFAAEPVLTHYDPEQELQVQTDAFDEMTGGVLSQRNAAGVWQPVAYFSKKMIPAECNYEIYDKEFLAIVKAFEEWRPELEGSRFPVEVITDHKNLEYFMFSKLLNRRQARWSEFLSRFNFKIIYRPGKQNQAVDALSRRSGDRPKKEGMWQQVLKDDNFEIFIENFKIFVMTLRASDSREVSPEIDSEAEEPTEAEDGTAPVSRISTPSSDNPALMLEGIVEAVRAAHQPAPTEEEEELDLEEQFDNVCQQDGSYQRIKNALATGHSRRIKNFSFAECTLVNEHVYYREDRKLVLDDDELRLRLIKLAHDTSLAGHSGAAKCYEILARNYFWIGMPQDVRRYVRNCYVCMKIKYFRNRYSGKLKPLPVPERRWTDISIDFVVALPPSKNLWGVECKNIMVVVDRLSKDVYYEPIDDLTFAGVAKVYYTNIWKHTGLPSTIVSDRGTQFVNDFWDELCKRLNITALLSTAYHPQTDGQTEIANAIMEQYLRVYCAYLQDDWAKWLPSANFAARNHHSESTQCTPFFANHGYHPRMGLEPRQDLAGPPRSERERRQRIHADEYAEKMNQINEELQAQMTWAQAWQEEYANRNREHAPRRQVGDKVWLDTRNLRTKRPTKKLSNKNEGPFEITAVISPHAYRLKLPDSWGCHDVFNAHLLHDSADDPLPGQAPPVPLPVNNSDHDGLYEVVRINDSRSSGGELEYLVTWKDAQSEDWWVRFEDCLMAPELLQEYHQNHPGRVGEDRWQAYYRTQEGSDQEYVDNDDLSSGTDS